MMIVVWTEDWPAAAKFQYLLQILEVTFKDCIPKWQTFVRRDDDFPTMILKWRVSVHGVGWTTSAWLHGRDLTSRMAKGDYI